MANVGEMVLVRQTGIHFVKGHFDFLSIGLVTKINASGEATQIKTNEGKLNASKFARYYRLPAGVTEEMALRAIPEGSDTFQVAGRAIQAMAA